MLNPRSKRLNSIRHWTGSETF